MRRQLYLAVYPLASFLRFSVRCRETGILSSILKHPKPISADIFSDVSVGIASHLIWVDSASLLPAKTSLKFHISVAQLLSTARCINSKAKDFKALCSFPLYSHVPVVCAFTSAITDV